MPEGDTVWQAAQRLDAALTGHTLTECDVRVPRYATVDLTGLRVDETVARGKHLLTRVGEFTIHTHLKMEGVWHVYPRGARWKRPAHQARIILGTDDTVAVGFALGITEVIERAHEGDVVGYLGPDLLGPDWDADAATANLVAAGDRPIGEALLDQRIMAGIGNVYRNEICFLRGVDPRTPTARVPDLPRTVDLAYRLLQANRARVARVTTGDRRPGRRSWVYGRGGKPCLRCGTTIVAGELGETPGRERSIFYCPRCQPPR
ncbi:DNA-formamidopyrimidine glycosylase family protein [Rhodococcus sp. SGAir0479]|uniref:DNA-formamidopyrimidine glycosylase family protein n=1 Tax=Rhodococcus sp. SGAir0479 TaxID=2567884 RepID=UPI0010CD3182|nr:DNA-formamidopyrimidine glycosylase family protein [Rhodococcus sp. SGAir0479]QCQ92055.1 Fpg/Nei family DNA glycosylase [Rhodococcus sp. SGAir0479]